MKFCVIAACEKEGGIGKQGSIPWRSSIDLNYFRNITSGTDELKNILVMGRCTFESVGSKNLGHNRLTVVLSHDVHDVHDCIDDVVYYKGSLNPVYFKDFLIQAFPSVSIGTVFYCGGQTIYEQSLIYASLFDAFFITKIDISINDCDRYFDLRMLENTCCLTKSSFFEGTEEPNGTFMKYEPSSMCAIKSSSSSSSNTHEMNYLILCKKILLEGETRDDRTGVGTISLFGQRLEFSLRDGIIPCLTSKKLALKAVIKELLWFISGSTNSKELENEGVKIWTGNTSREFLDKRGLTDLEEGDIGAGYGFQWRHFGAGYKGMQECYDDKGVDQVREIIDLIKNDPFSRRIILTAWNPAALSRMALPPCHMMAQFYVSRDGLLECQMYQRSCDVFLGVPFNIMSYSLLTHMIAHVCGIKASKLTMCFGDTHIYKNHLEQVLTQMKNVPKDFPTVSLSSNVTNIFDFTLDDIHIENYESHPYIRAPMAV